jgi:hypothetical protein
LSLAASGPAQSQTFPPAVTPSEIDFIMHIDKPNGYWGRTADPSVYQTSAWPGKTAFRCVDNNGADPCFDAALTANSSVHIVFAPTGGNWEWPVHVQGGDCNVHQSVMDAIIKVNTQGNTMDAADLQCDLDVVPGLPATQVDVLYRSGIPAFCFQGTNPAPTAPSISSTWVWSVSDFPTVPAPWPKIAPGTDCGSYPSSDVNANKDG